MNESDTTLLIVCTLLFLLDYQIIMLTRKLIRSFLLAKNNKKYERKLYKQQRLFDKITLCYLKAHLKMYQREYDTWLKVYQIKIVCIIPQVISVLLLMKIAVQYIFIYLFALIFLKGLALLLFRVFMFPRGLIEDSKYVKRK